MRIDVETNEEEGSQLSGLPVDVIEKLRAAVAAGEREFWDQPSHPRGSKAKADYVIERIYPLIAASVRGDASQRSGLGNDRIPVHLGDVLLGYARFRLDGHLQMINATDDEKRARSQAALANRGWIEEKAEAPAAGLDAKASRMMQAVFEVDAANAREVVLSQLTRAVEMRLHRGDLVNLAASPELSRAAQAAAEAVLGQGVLLPPGWSLEWLQDPQARPDEEAIRIPVTQAEAGVGYAVDRDALGRLVRDEWIAWAREQHPELQKRSWLIPWEELSEAEREVDRRIGERLYVEGAGFRRLAVETLEAAAGKTTRDERHAALLEIADTVRAPGSAVEAKQEAPSYHDLHITTDEIPRTSIFDLPYNVEVKCNRVAGWEVWDSSQKTWRLLGGECNAEPEEPEGNEEGRPVLGGLRLDVAGFVIVDSLGKEASDD